jgi:hypothetical protein
MDDENMNYEYKITKKIYLEYNKIILNELNKIIIGYIELIIRLLQNKNKDDSYILDFCKKNIFTDITSEYGHIKTDKLFSTLNTFADLIDLSKQLNIREKMTFIKNFQRTLELNCLMYEMLLEYKKDKILFKSIYNNVDTNHIDKIIKTIENLMDFKIEETDLCYDDDYNLSDCNEKNKKLYNKINDSKEKFENEYPNLCSLWLPVVYLFSYQNSLKGEKYNRLNKLIKTFVPKKVANPDCIIEIFKKYPLIEPLTTYEKDFLQSKSYDENNLPYKLVVCSFDKINSFYLKLRSRKNKLSISYSSGHAILFLLISNYIKNINLYYVILAIIIWLTPYNHSINEILSASKQYGLLDEYNYDISSLENINILLKKINLEEISLD